MSAFRCSICNANYPIFPAAALSKDGWPEDEGEPCPMCGEPVDGLSNADPDSAVELGRRISARRFEEWVIAEPDEERLAREAAHQPVIDAALAKFSNPDPEEAE